MREYIDREKAIESIRLTYCKDCNNYNGVRCRACEFDDAMMEIEDCPTADVVEVRHGHWIENEDDFWVMCSECGTEFLDDQIGIVDTYKFCPHCGTKMKGGEEE
jgi:hypothetical protein